MVTVKQGMSLPDAVIASAGSLEDWFAFARLNGLGYTAAVQTGEVLKSTGLVYVANDRVTNDFITVKPVLTLVNQTVFDMAIQQLGSVEAVFALARLNNMSYTGALVSGQQLNYSITPVNKAVLKTYQDNNYKPATGTTLPGTQQPVQLQGIGYWVIGYNFIVS